MQPQSGFMAAWKLSEQTRAMTQSQLQRERPPLSAVAARCKAAKSDLQVWKDGRIFRIVRGQTNVTT